MAQDKVRAGRGGGLEAHEEKAGDPQGGEQGCLYLLLAVYFLTGKRSTLVCQELCSISPHTHTFRDEILKENMSGC